MQSAQLWNNILSLIMFVTDKVDKIPKLTTKVNKQEKFATSAKELSFWNNRKYEVISQVLKCSKFSFPFSKTILVAAVDVCVGKNQLEVDKRDKIGNIGRRMQNLSKYVSQAFNININIKYMSQTAFHKHSIFKLAMKLQFWKYQIRQNLCRKIRFRF